MTPKTLRDAQALAAAKGITLSDDDRLHIQKVQQAERARLVATTPQTIDMAARWNRFYPRLLQAIISIGQTLLTFAQTVIVSLGVPVVLVLLLIVEHQRVVHGIQLFEVDQGLASSAALALVLSNLVLEFQIHHIENAAGYKEDQGKRWSLAIWAQNAAYKLGTGKTWTVQYVSPAQRYKGLLRLVTFSILALALVGSMRTVIEGQNGAWFEAIGAILTESTLLLLMTWIGGLLFAVAAVLTAQGLSRYVAIRCVEIIASMQTAQADSVDPFAAQVDEAGALELITIINGKLQAAKAVKVTKPTAEAVVIPSELRPLASEGDHAKNGVLGLPGNTLTVKQQPGSEYVGSENGNGRHS